MIKISELKNQDIGRWVIYCGFSNEKDRGKIKSWNKNYIFVVYNCDKNWHRFQDYTAAATEPFYLTFDGRSRRKNG